MGCCADYREKPKNVDQYTSIELKMGLHHVKIREFANLLKEAAIDRQVTIKELGDGFATQQFGKNLLKDDKSHPALLMLSHPIFQSSGEQLDRFHLMPLGLLYSRGTASEKLDILYETYDMNEDGVLFTTMIKQIIRDFVTIAAVIIPSIAHKKDFIKAQEENKDAVEKLVNQAMTILFGKQLSISKQDMKDKVESEVGYLINPVKIRQEMVFISEGEFRPSMGATI